MKKIQFLGLMLSLAAVLVFAVSCKIDVDSVHDHTFSETWESDETNHWHKATCEHTTKVKDKTGHKWDAGSVTTPATCTADGVKTYTCTVCGQGKTEVIATKGHSWDIGTVIKPDTCTTEGEKICTCILCKETTIAATGPASHSWGEKYEVNKAENFTNGSYKHKCSVCQCEETVTVKPEEQTLLDTLGALKVIQDSELAAYGITNSSVPAKINGATYVTFGVYPQKILTGAVTVADGTAGVNGGKAIKNGEISGADYYLGSDGNWYAKLKENACESGYNYSNGTTVAESSANSYKYFKVEPVVWRVLKDSDGKYMILAEKLLTANVAYYPYSNVNRTIDNKTVYPNNYEHSSIRAFLNGLSYEEKASTAGTQSSNSDYLSKGFLQQAFTDNQQEKIALTTVDNSVSSITYDGDSSTISDTYTCPDTTDKIFLLSEKEVTTSGYGFAAYNDCGTGNARIRKTTDYAKANYCYDNPAGCWWLRSPDGSETKNVHLVFENGLADDTWLVNDMQNGLLPALFVTK